MVKTENNLANEYLMRKGVVIAYLHYVKHFNIVNGEIANLTEEQKNLPNIFYVAKKGTLIWSPVDDKDEVGEGKGLERLEYARRAGQIIAEIPFVGDDLTLFVKAATIVRAKLGNVTLADVVDIPYADKSEIKKLITRLKRSKTEAELKARGEELQSLIDQYEERENDTENSELQEKFQLILESLEGGQQELEKGNVDEAISEIEESLYY